MTRKTIFKIVIIISVTFITFFIYSKIKEHNRNPIDEEFYGVVSDIKRLYPGLVEFSFLNQNKSYYMRSDLIKFKESVSIGDSISKVKNEFFLSVFKKNGNNFFYHDKFEWK